MSLVKKQLVVKLELPHYLLNTEKRRIMATRPESWTGRTSLGRAKTPVEDRETRNHRLGVDDGDSTAGDMVDGDIVDDGPMDGDNIHFGQYVSPYEPVKGTIIQATGLANSKRPITQRYNGPPSLHAASSGTTSKRNRSENEKEESTSTQYAKRVCRTIDFSRFAEPKRSAMMTIYSCIISNWDEKGFQDMMDKLHHGRTSMSWEDNKAVMEELATLSHDMKRLATRIPPLVAAERFLERELRRKKDAAGHTLVADRITSEIVKAVSLNLKQGLYDAEISADARHGAPMAALVDCLTDVPREHEFAGNKVQRPTTQAVECHRAPPAKPLPDETMPSASELNLPKHDSVVGDETADGTTSEEEQRITAVPIAAMSHQLHGHGTRPPNATFAVAETVPSMGDPMVYATDAAAKTAGRAVFGPSSPLTKLMLETRRVKEQRAMSAREEKENSRRAREFAQKAKVDQLKAEEHNKKAKDHEHQALCHAQSVRDNEQKAIEYGQRAAVYMAKVEEYERTMQAKEEEAHRVCEDAGNALKRTLRERYQLALNNGPDGYEAGS
ncbi:hypothetical protein TI39_contig4128g00024 [Zymoseptoria brevis]|uniref:Uncharacterized protein n=1 Tax=Zymoseptoria brevis TaxID=1047168 RepID=A0A0F4GCT9_9PEZI|nr:hypothetical protein TI39_contig4128g00024 [Zymoseptoria brevis]